MDNDFEDDFTMNMIRSLRSRDPYVFTKASIGLARTAISDAQRFCVASELVERLIVARARLIDGVESGVAPRELSTL